MTDIFLYPGEANPYDVRLRDPLSSGSAFPAQFLGLRAYFQGAVKDLCLVATADAPVGMGAQIFVNKNSTPYCVYLVETSDPNASPVRVKTTSGTKAIRNKV